MNSDERRAFNRAEEKRAQDTLAVATDAPEFSRGVARSYSRFLNATHGWIIDATPDHTHPQRASGRSRRATVVLAPNVSGYAFTPWGCV